MPTIDSSTKRFFALILGSAFTALNHKFALGLSENEVLALVAFTATYILTSKGGEVLVARAEAKGVEAADTITNAEQANAAIAKILAIYAAAAVSPAVTPAPAIAPGVTP